MAKQYGAHAPLVGTKRAVIVIDEDGHRSPPARPPARARLPVRRRSPRGARRAALACVTASCLRRSPSRRASTARPDRRTAATPADCVAQLVGAEVVEVSLRKPPPLDRPLEVVARRRARGAPRRRRRWWPRARPAELLLRRAGGGAAGEVAAAVEAGRERWTAEHPFPTCVVCGPPARRATASRIFPAALPDRDGLFGACWTPGELEGEATAGCARVRVGRARLPHERAGRELRRGAADGARQPDRPARLPGARGRAAHDPVLGARRWTAASAGPAPRCTTRTACSPARRARSGSSCASSGSRVPRMATHYRTCPFCEATCGLEIETEGREVVSVRGDADDVFSHGFICPKAYGIKQLHEDPDRLTDAARCAATASSSRPPGTRHSRRSTGGSPADPRGAREERGGRLPRQPERAQPVVPHPRAGVPARARARRTSTRRRPSTRCRSRCPPGSCSGRCCRSRSRTWTAATTCSCSAPTRSCRTAACSPRPTCAAACARIRERGGKVVVVDPRRTRTAEDADEHHFIRPGTDALLLAAIACTLVEEGLDDPGRRWPST